MISSNMVYFFTSQFRFNIFTKSLWRPPNGHPALEIFLSKVEKDLFDICKKQQTYSNFNSEEWKAMRSLADDRNLVRKTIG